MFKKILRASSSILLTFFIASYSMFSGISPLESAQVSSDSHEDNYMGIVIEESSVAIDESKTSSAPDLGDDQAFPFIPGFGKNSGKD